MNSIKNWQTAQIPSGFGMPISGRHLGGCPVADVRLSARVRDAVITTTEGPAKRGTAAAVAYFPGTSAWRPPTC